MRYRYYVSQPLVRATRGTSPEGLRIAAGEIERIVVSGIEGLLSDPGRLTEALGPYTASAGEQQRLLARASEIASACPQLPAERSRALIQRVCRRIALGQDRVEIEITVAGLCALLRGEPAEPEDSEAEHLLQLSFPTRLQRVGQGKRLLIDAAAQPGLADHPDPKLIKLIVRAHGMREKLRTSPGRRIAHLAMREKLSQSYAALLLRLSFLAPDITRAILEGRQPAGFTAHKLKIQAALPLAWAEQRRVLGFG
jgi:hypothetical protein